MKRSEIAFGLIRIPTDFFMTLLAFMVAYQLRTTADFIPSINVPFDTTTFPSLGEYTSFSISAAQVLVIIFALRKAYSLKHTFRIGQEYRQIIINCTIWLMAIIAYFFLIRSFPYSRLALLYTWILAIAFIAIGRTIIRAIQHFALQAGIGKKPLLFIGNNAITEKLTQAFKKNISYKIIGSIENIHELPDILKKHHIEEIIQTKTNLTHKESEELLAFCREHHISFNFVPDILELQQANIETETWADIPVIKLKPTPLEGWGKVGKRTFDIVCSILGLIILSPVFLIVAIAIKLDSKGTVFFKLLDDGSRVKRVGEHGRLFNFYKFRSMHPNTHNLRYTQLADKNTRTDSPLVKIKNDPRITRVGKFLRKTSIDELPQLFNVLKGEMSLVGPRPHLPEEVEKYQKHHKFVLEIKPGITGLAQIGGRSDLNFEEEVRLDTFYIEHWSLWMDIKILIKTLKIPFRTYEE